MQNLFRLIVFLGGILMHFEAFTQSLEQPVINYVSVDTTSKKPEISWSYETPELIDGYGIIRFIYDYPPAAPLTYQTIHTIEDPYINYFQDLSEIFGSALPYQQIEKYKIIAFNISGSDTIYSLPSEVHQTILLNLNYDYCNKLLNLNWNRYLGWGSNFNQYQIFCKTNMNDYKIMGRTYNEFDTTFQIQNMIPDSIRSFFIKAVNNNNYESISNIVTTDIQLPQIPNFIHADSLIVDTQNQLTLYFSVDNIPSIYSLSLYKADNLFSDFVNVSNSTDISSKLILSDPDFDFSIPNVYFLQANDYCENPLIISDTVSSVSLKIENSQFINHLSWRSNSIFESYNIKRIINNTIENIATTVLNSFDDDISGLLEYQFNDKPHSGKYCYFIEAVDENFLSSSNQICVNNDPIYYFPNAFNPNSVIEENKTFKPKIANISDYNIIIYNNFGTKIFESYDPMLGWNGKLPNGSLAPLGSYIYYYSFTDADGKKRVGKNVLILVYN